MPRPLNVLLVISILIFVGLWFGERRAHLAAEVAIADLEPEVARIDVIDPDRIHVRMVDYQPARKLVWQIYAPEGTSGYYLSHAGTVGGAGGGGSTGPENFLLRANYSPLLNGGHQFSLRVGGVTTGSRLDPSCLSLLREHWNDFDVSLTGIDVIHVAPPDEVVTLARIVVPTDVLEQAKDRLDRESYRRLRERPVMHFILGPDAKVAASIANGFALNREDDDESQ